MPVTRDNTSKTTQTTTLPSLKSNNPDSGLTGEVQEELDSKTKKNNLASVQGSISDLFKEVKKTIRSRFMVTPHRERTMKYMGFITQRKNSDSGLTGKVQMESDSKTKKNNLASVPGVISDMFKEVKNTVSERTVLKSSSSQKKKSCWMKKYFDREVPQVGALDKSSDDDWTLDMSELIRWKEMASRVRCPIFKEDHAGPPESGLED